MKVGADTVGQCLDAGGAHSRGVMRQVLALAPAGQIVRMAEMLGTTAKQVVVQIRDHGALIVVDKRG